MIEHIFAHAFDVIYQRTPRGIARLGVATLSGALIAVIAVLAHNGPIGRAYWYLFAGIGMAIGLVGGAVLGFLEYRETMGQGLPMWLTVSRRIVLTVSKLVLLGLFVLLFYVMYRMVRDEHLYGF